MIRHTVAGTTGRLLHLLLAPAVALLAVACDDSSTVQEPTVTGGEVAAAKAPATITRGSARWADGYVTVPAPYSGQGSFNRTGGAVTTTMLGGGRARVTFSGLSAFLGRTSTLHVTGTDGPQHCKPVEAYLVRNEVEVHCYDLSTGGAPTELWTRFTLEVTRNYADVAYAYADRPTSTNYSPADRGSWNPASTISPYGTINVVRTGVGQYQVVFYELQRIVWDANNNGHWQVTAVGTDNVFCKLASAGGSTAMFANVRCYTPAGAPADSKFTVLFALPSSHIAYAYNNQVTPAENPIGWFPPPFDSWNPSGAMMEVHHYNTGAYWVYWHALSTQIVGTGVIYVTAEGSDNEHCGSGFWQYDSQSGAWGALVKCRYPNGQPADSRFRVMLGS